RIGNNISEEDSMVTIGLRKGEDIGISLQVFPNPTMGEMLHIVATRFSEKEEGEFTLYNSSGVKKTTFIEKADKYGRIERTIYLSPGIPSGTYFLMLRIKNNILTQKVIITY